MEEGEEKEEVAVRQIVVYCQAGLLGTHQEGEIEGVKPGGGMERFLGRNGMRDGGGGGNMEEDESRRTGGEEPQTEEYISRLVQISIQLSPSHWRRSRGGEGCLPGRRVVLLGFSG